MPLPLVTTTSVVNMQNSYCDRANVLNSLPAIIPNRTYIMSQNIQNLAPQQAVPLKINTSSTPFSYNSKPLENKKSSSNDSTPTNSHMMRSKIANKPLSGKIS